MSAAASAVVLTAVIHCKPEAVETVLAALIAVGAHVRDHEPDTLDFRVVRSDEDPTLLLTHERFTDAAAMQAHNDGAGSKTFFAATRGLLERVEIFVGTERFSKR